MGWKGRRRNRGGTRWRLSLAYVTLTIDAIASGWVHFHPPFDSPIDPLSFSYNNPGSCVWDVWLLSVFRVFGCLLSALLFDCLRSSPKSGTSRSRTASHSGILGSNHGHNTVSGHHHQDDEELDHHSHWSERWAKALASTTCTVSLLAIVAKCLVRLILGTSAESDSYLWFWLPVGVGALMSLVDYKSLALHFHWIKDREEEEDEDNEHHHGDDLHHPLLSEEGRSQAIVDGNDNNRRCSTTTSSSRRKNKNKKNTRNATPKDLFSLIKPDLHLIALAFVFLLAAAVCQVMLPHFTGMIMDVIVSANGDKDQFRKYTTYLVLSAAFCGIFTGLRGGTFTVIGNRVNARIRQMLFGALLRQEIGFFDTTKTGEISSRLNSDTTKVGDQVSLNVNFFLRNLVQATGTLIFMFSESWKLSLTAFISVPVIVLLSTKYGAFIRKISKQTQEKLAQANSVAEEALSSMSTIRYFACESEEEKVYHKTLSEYTALGKREGTAYAFYACSTVLMPNCVTALVLFYGGKLVIQGEITSGKLVSFLLYLSSLSDAFNNMGSIFSALTQALGAADKVFELIKREPRIITRPDGALAPAECGGRLELKNIVFRYPARPKTQVLNNLSMVAEPGQVVALVGPSGGGKSSCIALIEHLYEPERGEVLLDGNPVWAYDHHWYHRHVSIVGQEPILYGRSIRRNIVFGLEGTPYEPTDEEIRHAAMLANAHEFIMSLPDGYETEVGERGVCLSGGQKQRVAISRALARKPRVLLLDEATSALDAESEHQVQQAIDNMISIGGMTVVIIAHRLSTILTADKILVIKGGVVVEEGRHEQLIKKDGGVYAQLVAKQMGGGVTENSPPPPSGP